MNYLIAAELNNLGGSYLHLGDLKKSMELFRDALRYTLVDLNPARSAECAAVGPFETVQPSGHASKEEESEPMDMELPSPPSPCECMKPTSSSAPFVHFHAINVIPSPQAYSPDTLVNTTVVSSIVLFNLGIVYHLKGLETSGEESRMRLTKARSFYHKSQLLLADAGIPATSVGNPVLDMLLMALYNNLAEVSYEMQSYSESRQYFEGLIRFALTVAPSNYGDATIAAMVDQQKSNFLLNAIILLPPKIAAAA